MTKKKKPEDLLKVGRPTSYDDKFLIDIIELGRAGKLPAQVASTFGVTKKTLHLWCAANPKFLHAYGIYKEHCEARWLQRAEDQADGGIGNFNATKFMLAAAFRYTEKTEVVTDPDNTEDKFAPVEINYNTPQPKV
jgi:hypothetical protein